MSKFGFSTTLIILIIVIPAIAFFALNLFIKNFNNVAFPVETPISISTSTPNTQDETVQYHPSFEIYTNGTKRVFTAAMYHNLSEDVYIESSDSSKIKVEKAGILWQEFFDTLPFEIDKDCLHTGTSQTFCTDKDGTLRFFLNGEENSKALDLPIMPSDQLVVRYE